VLVMLMGIIGNGQQDREDERVHGSSL
jgi:hypothetical protein